MASAGEMPNFDERRRCDRLWDELLARGGPCGVEPATLRALRLYGGAQGVWVDKATTASAQAPHGAAVSVLHTGRSYADDLASDGVVYHYPDTARPAGREPRVGHGRGAGVCDGDLRRAGGVRRGTAARARGIAGARDRVGAAGGARSWRQQL